MERGIPCHGTRNSSTDIAQIVGQARQRVRTAVKTAMVYAYYEIGRHIVEY